MGQNLSHAQIWAYGFWLITQPFFVQLRWNPIHEFRRPLATGIPRYNTWNLVLFGHKYWRGCNVGTGERLGSGTTSKVLSQVLVCWSTAMSESSFTKIPSWTPIHYRKWICLGYANESRKTSVRKFLKNIAKMGTEPQVLQWCHQFPHQPLSTSYLVVG